VQPHTARPQITAATVILEFDDGTGQRYRVHRPRGFRIESDWHRHELDLSDDLATPVEVPRVFPVQIGFVFALPLSGPPPVSHRLAAQSQQDQP
jgi:hypothetical protein